MAYVWIVETDGKKRFVDDKYIAPCRKCGESISKCREADVCVDERADVMCIFCSDVGCDVCEQSGCQICNRDKGCVCDVIEDERTGN